MSEPDEQGLDALEASEIAEGVRTGSLRATDVCEHFLARAWSQRSLGAFVHLDPDSARARAAAIDEAVSAGTPVGPLAGVPVGLKDMFVTRDVPTTCGSRMLRDWRPPYEGTQAARLERAGAVSLGKLAMDEFAMGSSNENTPWGVVHNPWSVDHVPGGSSGGSAAAVASGSVVLALGSDTGGSIRQPASLCGVVGIKPTWGRVSRHGMIAFASSLDQAGVLARTVADAALGLEAIAGLDPLDATSADRPVPPWSQQVLRSTAASAESAPPLRGRRVGVFRRALDMPGLDDAVRDRFDRAIEVLVDQGAEVCDVELPHFDHAVATYYVLATAEAASNLARYDGLRYGARVDGADLLETYERTRGSGFGAEVRRRVLLGTFVLRADSYEEYYGRAMRVRRLIANDHAAAFATCDVIATPVSPVPGFRLGERVGDPLQMYLSDVFTIGANLAGLPAISIPAGFSGGPAGATLEEAPPLPIGLHLTADAWDESALFAFAAAHEAATDHHLRRPPANAGGAG